MDENAPNEIEPATGPDEGGRGLLGTIKGRDHDGDDRLAAVRRAGDMEVINDDLARALLELISSGDEPDELRAAAAIALGPVLEYGDVDGFDDPEWVPIAEKTFRSIQEAMREQFATVDLPKKVRRMVLEGSVRAPQKWHARAVRDAYASGDDEWRLSAVFCMEYLSGFDEQILESLDSDDPNIHYHAVIAAGNWELGRAWRHVAGLLTSPETDKPVLLAAMEAALNIRPDEAAELVGDLLDSDDDDIVDAAHEALAMAEAMTGMDFDDEDEEEW